MEKVDFFFFVSLEEGGPLGFKLLYIILFLTSIQSKKQYSHSLAASSTTWTEILFHQCVCDQQRKKAIKVQVQQQLIINKEVCWESMFWMDFSALSKHWDRCKLMVKEAELPHTVKKEHNFQRMWMWYHGDICVLCTWIDLIKNKFKITKLSNYQSTHSMRNANVFPKGNVLLRTTQAASFPTMQRQNIISSNTNAVRHSSLLLVVRPSKAALVIQLSLDKGPLGL